MFLGGIWNSDSLQYVENDNGWSANGNNITLTNHSNVNVNADFSFEPETNFSGVTGSYVSNNKPVTSVTISSACGTTLANAPKQIVDLAISGNASTSTSAIMGHTKVTIAKSAVQS